MATNNLMDNLQVDIQLNDDMKNLLKNYPQIYPLATKKGLSAVARTGAKNVRNTYKAQGFVGKGKLIKSVRASTTNKKSSYGSTSFVARIIEVGAKPHTEYPKKKSIMWFGKYFAHRVHHPGLPAFEIFKRTQEQLESSGQMNQIFNDAVRAAIEKVQNG